MTTTEPSPFPSREAYHADRSCVSHSALMDFDKSVPLFHGRYITGTIAPRESTDAMSLGTALHLLTLEPEKFHNEIAIKPDGIDRRTKAGKEAWAEFCQAAGRRAIITAEDFETARRMATAIRSDAMARRALDAAGPVEKPLKWQCEESGLWARSLVDKFAPDMRLAIDLKTTDDPSPGAFAWSCKRYGYHRQAALYSRGIREVHGIEVDFMFIVVGSEEPHEVACYVLDADALDTGHRLNQAALNEIAERMRTDSWRGRHADRIQVLSLPR